MYAPYSFVTRVTGETEGVNLGAIKPETGAPPFAIPGVSGSVVAQVRLPDLPCRSPSRQGKIIMFLHGNGLVCIHIHLFEVVHTIIPAD